MDNAVFLIYSNIQIHNSGIGIIVVLLFVFPL